MNLNEIRNELSDIVGTSVFLPDHAEDQYWRLVDKIDKILDELDNYIESQGTHGN